jgi:hypothetical protein
MEECVWIVVGDVHENVALVDAVPEIPQAAAVIISGDLTNVGGKEAACRVLDVFARRSPQVLAQIGNMDTTQVASELDSRRINIHRQVRELAPGVGLAGVGYSTRTPFGTPSEVDEATMAAWAWEVLEAATARFAHVLFVVHTPPHATATDRLASGASVGSPGVRAAIEAFAPEVVVTGHIHEGRGEDWIGTSHILNPGAFGQGGYVLVRRTPQGLQASLQQVGRRS